MTEKQRPLFMPHVSETDGKYKGFRCNEEIVKEIKKNGLTFSFIRLTDKSMYKEYIKLMENTND